MPLAAFLLAFCSAFVHALWNTLLSRARDSEAATAVALVAGALAFAPVAALTWEISSRALPYLAASAVLEVGYFVLLAAAYERGELSLIYPVARGSAPLLVALFSVVLLGTRLHALTVVGVVLVAGGIVAVRGLAGAGGRHLTRALAIGAMIAAYTLFDKAGLRHAQALTYLELVVLPSAIVYPPLIARRKGRAALRAEVGGPAVVAGIAMFGAFALALAAIRLAPQPFVPGVQAIRETSVVIAVAAGALILGEPVGRARALGAIAVVAGVIALAGA
ncbi:MAG: EamA family transporter [Thermoleophilaceae bacterium]